MVESILLLTETTAPAQMTVAQVKTSWTESDKSAPQSPPPTLLQAASRLSDVLS